MRPFLTLAIAGVGLAASAGAATLPLFQNNGITNNPQIDATAVVNNGTIFTFTSLPYDTANTLFYTNSVSGVMQGDVGFRFEFITNSVRLPAANVVNKGTISATTHILINATNVTNSGTMTVSPQGLVRIQGQSVNLGRGSVSAGSSVSSSFNDGFDFGDFYVNADGVTDLYWGVGTNNVFSGAGQNLLLPNFRFFPQVRSPLHQVVHPFAITNFVRVPESLRDFAAFAYTDQIIGVVTQLVVQVVFVPTNTVAGLTTTVRFDADSFARATVPIVEFAVADADVTTGGALTNFVYLMDQLGAVSTPGLEIRTNALNSGTANPTFKPSTYQLRRTTPFAWLNASNANTPFTTNLLVGPYISNSVPAFYAGYSARVGQPVAFSGSGTTLAPSNAPGRVEITGGTMDLSRARIRAENYINITSSNLIGNSNTVFDAPFVNFKFTTTNEQLVIDNLVSNSVRRLQGELSAWSATWTNFLPVGLVTQTVILHALIVDHNFTADSPVFFGDLSVKGNSFIVNDSVIPQLSLLIDAAAVTLGSNGVLSFPGDAGALQFPALRCLTNFGFISISGIGRFGTDVPQPLSNVINHGTISAASLEISARLFEDTGSLQSFFGPLSLQFTSGLLSNDFISANGNLSITGSSNTAIGSTLSSGAALIFNLTNHLGDSGPASLNFWSVRDGFQFLTRPATGDLLGTTLLSTAPSFAAVSHLSALTNRGATTNGYGNNAALGRLILDGGPASLILFSPIGTNQAIYVDFLELRNGATNYLTALQIDPGMTVYFADANLPAEKLDGALNGRLRWVSSYAGANSSTTVTNSDGSTVVVNRALRDSSTIDSDADGIPNRYDATPFDPVAMSLAIAPSVSLGDGESVARISWEAAANTTYRVECRPSLSAPWQFLLNHTHGSKNGTAIVTDSIAPGGTCFYRVVYFY